MEKTFQTGSFSFRLRFPEELVLPADMEKFAVEKESADYTYTITIVDTLPEAEGELLVNRVDLQVFRNGEGLESRLIGVKGEERPMHCIGRQHKIMHRCLSEDGIWMELQNMRLYFCLFLHWNAACRSVHA